MGKLLFPSLFATRVQPAFRKALEWAEATLRTIAALPALPPPFYYHAAEELGMCSDTLQDM